MDSHFVSRASLHESATALSDAYISDPKRLQGCIKYAVMAMLHGGLLWPLQIIAIIFILLDIVYHVTGCSCIASSWTFLCRMEFYHAIVG